MAICGIGMKPSIRFKVRSSMWSSRSEKNSNLMVGYKEFIKSVKPCRAGRPCSQRSNTSSR